MAYSLVDFNSRHFAAAEPDSAQRMAMQASAVGLGRAGGRRINTATLCDLIGSKYYPHNEEIEIAEEKMVKCFDENDALLGEMTLREARMAADTVQKDVVLRNAKVAPPVVKIMNYKKELLKRLFKKLGKQVDEKDMKSKQIRLQTTASYHDIENKKRQALGFLKTHQILKFYMKVNIYDPENIQKGRMMLLNIAEDLKADCKMTVSPAREKKPDVDYSAEPISKKPETLEEMQEGAEESKEVQERFVSLQGPADEGPDEADEDFEN